MNARNMTREIIAEDAQDYFLRGRPRRRKGLLA